MLSEEGVVFAEACAYTVGSQRMDHLSYGSVNVFTSCAFMVSKHHRPKANVVNIRENGACASLNARSRRHARAVISTSIGFYYWYVRMAAA